MQVEVLKGGWIKQGSVIAFPHEWQRPAKTEEWVFDCLINNESNSPFVEYIAFPWATLIDLLDRGRDSDAAYLLKALEDIPPKKTIVRATSCQHINFIKYNYLFEKIKITIAYWAHKVIKQNKINSIIIRPMALYPFVNEFNVSGLSDVEIRRKYAISFVGAYDAGCYISNIRNEILKLASNEKVYIKKRDFWHFENEVYQCQINKKNTLDLDFIQRTDEYVKILKDTKYSLCPSGSGPNSIRIWESIAFGCIPVILSDTLDMPSINNDISLIRCNEANFFEWFTSACEEKISYGNFNYVEDVSIFIGEIVVDLFDKKYINKIVG